MRRAAPRISHPAPWAGPGRGGGDKDKALKAAPARALAPTFRNGDAPPSRPHTHPAGSAAVGALTALRPTSLHLPWTRPNRGSRTQQTVQLGSLPASSNQPASRPALAQAIIPAHHSPWPSSSSSTLLLINFTRSSSPGTCTARAWACRGRACCDWNRMLRQRTKLCAQPRRVSRRACAGCKEGNQQQPATVRLPPPQEACQGTRGAEQPQRGGPRGALPLHPAAEPGSHPSTRAPRPPPPGGGQAVAFCQPPLLPARLPAASPPGRPPACKEARRQSAAAGGTLPLRHLPSTSRLPSSCLCPWIQTGLRQPACRPLPPSIATSLAAPRPPLPPSNSPSARQRQHG